MDFMQTQEVSNFRTMKFTKINFQRQKNSRQIRMKRNIINSQFVYAYFSHHLPNVFNKLASTKFVHHKPKSFDMSGSTEQFSDSIKLSLASFMVRKYCLGRDSECLKFTSFVKKSKYKEYPEIKYFLKLLTYLILFELLSSKFQCSIPKQRSCPSETRMHMNKQSPSSSQQNESICGRLKFRSLNLLSTSQFHRGDI